MSSPLGTILANVFVGSQEALFLKKRTCRRLYYCRRLFFKSFKTRRSSVKFNSHLNQMNPALQFTSENEDNNQLPYLDVLVMRKSYNLLTILFRKPTFSCHYVRWSSFCHDTQKIRLVETLRIYSPSML